MTWQETSKNNWQLRGKANAAEFKLAVFQPIYDRSHWYFSLNDRDVASPFKSREQAQAAAIAAAIAWIDDLVLLKRNLELLQTLSAEEQEENLVVQ